MKNIYASFLVFVLFFQVHNVQALTPAEELASILEKYETIKGDFNQTIVDSKGSLIEESLGVFTVKSPGLFYWETKKPYPQLLVADLNTISLYDPDLEQVTVSPYNNSMDQSPALLLSGKPEQIVAHYNVEYSDAVSGAFILKPKAAGGNFTKLEMIFDNDLLLKLILHDSLGQTTTFNLNNLILNQAVSDDLFTFNAPSGVDIITNE